MVAKTVVQMKEALPPPVTICVLASPPQIQIYVTTVIGHQSVLKPDTSAIISFIFQTIFACRSTKLQSAQTK